MTAIAARGEVAGIHAESLRSGDPADEGGERFSVLRAVELRAFLRVEQTTPRLQQKDFNQIAVVLPEIEQVAIGSPVAIEILDQRTEDAAKVVPSLDLGDVDPRGFYEVGPVAEQTGMDIVRQPERAAPRGPGSE